MKIYHDVKKETMWEKTKWFLKLSLTERYRVSFGIAAFHGILHKGIEDGSRGSFKTIQVLKKRRR